MFGSLILLLNLSVQSYAKSKSKLKILKLSRRKDRT